MAIENPAFLAVAALLSRGGAIRFSGSRCCAAQPRVAPGPTPRSSSLQQEGSDVLAGQGRADRRADSQGRRCLAPSRFTGRMFAATLGRNARSLQDRPAPTTGRLNRRPNQSPSRRAGSEQPGDFLALGQGHRGLAADSSPGPQDPRGLGAKSLSRSLLQQIFFPPSSSPCSTNLPGRTDGGRGAAHAGRHGADSTRKFPLAGFRLMLDAAARPSRRIARGRQFAREVQKSTSTTSPEKYLRPSEGTLDIALMYTSPRRTSSTSSFTRSERGREEDNSARTP